MERKDKKHINKTDYMILVGFIIMALFWLFDAAIDTRLLGEGHGQQHGFMHYHEGLIDYLFFVLQVVLIVFMWGVFRKRRRLEKALHDAMLKTDEEKARSEAIIAAMGDGVSIQDTDFKVLYQNQVHRELTGGYRVGSHCYQAYAGRDEVCEGCPVARVFQDGLIHKLEKTLPPGGKVSHIEITASPLRDTSGKIIAGIEVVRDISGHKRLEEKLRMHLVAMEASMDGIAILNQDAEYIYLNQAHVRVYGYDSAEELVGKSWRVLYHEEEAARIGRDITAGFRESGGWRGEATGKRRDGSTFPQEISLTVMEDRGIICIVRDISDRRQVEEEINKLNEALEQRALDLFASNRELEAFSYSVSHDLRTPLTRIYGAGQALQEDYAAHLDETGRFFVQTICEASENMEGLIDALLVLSRLTSSEMVSEEVDLSGLAREIATELQSTQPDRQVELVFAPGIRANGSGLLLKVALENLLGNAWKYTRLVTDARIEFGVTEHEGERVYFVRDNGAGFDMRYVDRLFKPFQRLHNAGEFPGTGIGLATVQRIIHRHGGRVWGEGEANKGATFYFTLK